MDDSPKDPKIAGLPRLAKLFGRRRNNMLLIDPEQFLGITGYVVGPFLVVLSRRDWS